MKLEHAYANFEQTGPDAAEFDSNCWAGKRGLFVQILRDADVRTAQGSYVLSNKFVGSENLYFDWFISARDIMNGKKTKDFYYLQLQKLASFDESTDLDSINQCIKSARVSDD